MDDDPIAPTFFLKVKGSHTSTIEAERQASYYGALGSQVIHALQAYKQEEPAYDDNAYTITSTYSRGILELYAVHIAEPKPGEGPEYIMTPLGDWPIHANLESFQQGLTAYQMLEIGRRRRETRSLN
ncbi:uncharacterized protein BJX67DRAFT_379671 [Aspergillus lucknowensis]|uniref:Uncharacterized protein n=1 Tax=Aspergillus lucknowensis TaxID=176173 RepID=A0ABR4LW03_9EURO